MADKKRSKKAILSDYVAEARPVRIGREEWRELQQRLDPVSDSYLRKLLRSSGISLDPVVEGVRQDSFEQLERTLLALCERYGEADQAGDKGLSVECRQAVLTAKEHARLSLRRLSGEEQAGKREMISWMLVWLENPAVFPAWLRLRKRASAKPEAEPAP